MICLYYRVDYVVCSNQPAIKSEVNELIDPAGSAEVDLMDNPEVNQQRRLAS